MKRTKLYILLSLFLISCSGDKEFSKLDLLSSQTINENSDVFINSLVQADFLTDEELIILSSKSEIICLDTKTGNLSPFININSEMVWQIKSFIQEQLPELTFLNDSLSRRNYTIMIGGFQIIDSNIFINLTLQFPIQDEFEGLSATIVKFFYVIQKYEKSSKLLKNQYVFKENTKTIYSKGDEHLEDNFFSPRTGMHISGSKIFSKTNASPIKDSSHFMVKFDFDNIIFNKKIIPLYHNRNKQRRKDYSFNKASFYQRSNQLYCSDGKDLFELLPNVKLTREIINDKFFHVKKFKVYDNNEVLYIKKCDTSRFYSSLNVLSDNKRYELIPNSGNKRLFIISKGCNALTTYNDKYYYETYENYQFIFNCDSIYFL